MTDRMIEILTAAGRRSLGPDEKWCIVHPQGPLTDTASTDFTYPIYLLCAALGMDWEDLAEQGYRLGRVNTVTWLPVEEGIPTIVLEEGES